MPKPTIEARLTKLEQQVALLVGAGASSTEKNASRSNGRPRQPLVSRNKWQQTLGVFGPEDGMDAVFEAAMKLREQDRKQTQRMPQSKKVSAKSSRRRKLVQS